MNVSTQIRIDKDIKKKSTEIFKSLGLDMSSAVNLFLHQCVLKGGIPFSIDNKNYNEQTIKAMNEFYRMKEHPEEYKKYDSFEDLLKDID